MSESSVRDGDALDEETYGHDNAVKAERATMPSMVVIFPEFTVFEGLAFT